MRTRAGYEDAIACAPSRAQPAISEVIRLGQKKLSLAALRTIAREGPALELGPACLQGVRSSLATVERIVASGTSAYGINTGFGRLSQTRIAVEELEQLQKNIVLSHAAGTGPLLDDAATATPCNASAGDRLRLNSI